MNKRKSKIPRYLVAERYLRILSSKRDILASEARAILREKGFSWTSFQYGWLKEINHCHERTVIRNGIVIPGYESYEEKMQRFKEETEIHINQFGDIYWQCYELGNIRNERELAAKHVMELCTYKRIDFSKKIPRLMDYQRTYYQYCPLRDCSICGKTGGGDNVAYRGIYGNNIGLRYWKQAKELGFEWKGVKKAILCRKCLESESIRVRRARDVLKNRILINQILTQSKRLKEAKNG